MKKVFVTIVLVFVLCFSAYASNTDYSYLEDMTVNELKSLRDAINKILGDSGSSVAEYGVSGVYKAENYYTNKIIEFMPDSNSGTQGTFREQTEGSKYIDEGTYVVNFGKLTMTYYDSIALKTYDREYLISDNYIYRNGSAFKNFPDGDKISYETTSGDYSIKFDPNGNFTRISLVDKTETVGTYTINGNILSIITGEYTTNYYIENGNVHRIEYSK